LSTPDPARFNVYDELRSRLIARGIPQNEIAFIHDADSDAAKMNLFNAVNAGRVRILIGSTEKMGAGTNVQRRLAALHHLDAPWRPRDIEQREGRILRQGNLNPEVRIYRYVTEGSFDAYMWQTLETKARFIQQVMSGHTSVRAAEDLEAGALTYAEIKAIASGNPAVMEKVKVDTEVRKLDQLRSAHVNQQHSIRLQLHRLPLEIAETQRGLANVTTDIATRDAHDGQEFAMTVGNRVYSGKGAREEGAKALTYAVLSWRDDPTLQARGAFRGFEILSKGKPSTSLTDYWELQCGASWPAPGFFPASRSSPSSSSPRSARSFFDSNSLSRRSFSGTSTLRSPPGSWLSRWSFTSTVSTADGGASFRRPTYSALLPATSSALVSAVWSSSPSARPASLALSTFSTSCFASWRPLESASLCVSSPRRLPTAIPAVPGGL
jgi:hypothetical protein